MPRKNFMGLYLGEVADVRQALAETREAGFDYFCGNIVSDVHRQSALEGRIDDGNQPFGWFDMLLQSSDWCHSVVGILSDVHPHTESPNPTVRNLACKLVEKELGYGQHLALYSTMMNLPSNDSANLCRLLNSKLSNDGGGHSNMCLWVKMPMNWTVGHCPSQTPNGLTLVNGVVNGVCGSEAGDEEGFNTGEGSLQSSWNLWNKFRCAINGERRVQPVLDLPLDLPNTEEFRRWLGEPVKAICLSEHHFTTNAKGYPVLPRMTQSIVKDFIEIGAHVIFNVSPGTEPRDYIARKQYIEYLYNTLASEWENDPLIKYTKGYEDYLQSPLQPLMDNLEANTYEVFERDPTKYNLYEEAIGKALLAKVPEEEKDTKEVVCMVVGAGRGPLVRNCLKAAENVDRKVRVYAVEKNINAVCTLLHLKKQVWGDRVTVISSDMREWDAKEKADIMISELLGSFGDNELSPECLDGAQNFLKEDGIMIPKSYTSWVSPVMTPKLHFDVRGFADPNKYQWAHFETPFVVFMKNFYQIDKPKALFRFEHPNYDNQSNDRYETLEFVAQNDCMMHGMAGYFDSELFGGVMMSIHPDTKSKGMFSWFPIYFPIREPIPVRKGAKIKIHFWRCSNRHQVWYEWSVSEPSSPSAIHNVNGRSYTIGL